MQFESAEEISKADGRIISLSLGSVGEPANTYKHTRTVFHELSKTEKDLEKRKSWVGLLQPHLGGARGSHAPCSTFLARRCMFTIWLPALLASNRIPDWYKTPQKQRRQATKCALRPLPQFRYLSLFSLFTMMGAARPPTSSQLLLLSQQ
jgi:hypothetical protein